MLHALSSHLVCMGREARPFVQWVSSLSFCHHVIALWFEPGTREASKKRRSNANSNCASGLVSVYPSAIHIAREEMACRPEGIPVGGKTRASMGTSPPSPCASDRDIVRHAREGAQEEAMAGRRGRGPIAFRSAGASRRVMRRQPQSRSKTEMAWIPRASAANFIRDQSRHSAMCRMTRSETSR